MLAMKKNITISPVFYTTNINNFLDININLDLDKFNLAVDELKKDYCKNEFKRDDRFKANWDHITNENRETLIKILKMYCEAEYSGFILYKELSYQLKDEQPLLAEAFSLMSRDEARHASFLNQALADFNLQPKLDFLNKQQRKYQKLPFSWFLFSTYLSEKLSSCYYMTIFKQIQNNPQYSIYPLFDFYPSWSSDEKRHGNLLGVILNTQPQFAQGLKAKLSCKFLLLLIFSQSYLRHQNNQQILSLFGLNSRDYSLSTIKQVNHSIAQHLPLTLNLENSSFFQKLDRCLTYISRNEKVTTSTQNYLVKLGQKIINNLSIVFILLTLFFTPTITNKNT